MEAVMCDVEGCEEKAFLVVTRLLAEKHELVSWHLCFCCWGLWKWQRKRMPPFEDVAEEVIFQREVDGMAKKETDLVDRVRKRAQVGQSMFAGDSHIFQDNLGVADSYDRPGPHLLFVFAKALSFEESSVLALQVPDVYAALLEDDEGVRA